MLFFYIRHGDPIYDPDMLTPLGVKQAEAVAKRLALYGIDDIYCSTSERAKMTAQPTCDLLKKEMTLLDFTNEYYAWLDLTVQRPDGLIWLFDDKQTRADFTEQNVRNLSYDWYNAPQFEEHKQKYKKGMERVWDEADKFFSSLGYEHERRTGRYKVINGNDKRVALFAHQGFGMVFLSHILDIPYPQFGLHFNMCHTGMTVIEFNDENGYAAPRMLTLSNDSHLYREGLPTNYNNILRF